MSAAAASKPKKKRKPASKRRVDAEGKIWIRDDAGEWIQLGDDGCEARSDDEKDAGEDLRDFVVDEDDDLSIQERERLELAHAEAEQRNPHIDVDPSNIVTGKRQRKRATRYEETEEFKQQYLKLMQKELDRERRATAALLIAPDFVDPTTDLALLGCESRPEANDGVDTEDAAEGEGDEDRGAQEEEEPDEAEEGDEDDDSEDDEDSEDDDEEEDEDDDDDYVPPEEEEEDAEDDTEEEDVEPTAKPQSKTLPKASIALTSESESESDSDDSEEDVQEDGVNELAE